MNQIHYIFEKLSRMGGHCAIAISVSSERAATNGPHDLDSSSKICRIWIPVDVIFTDDEKYTVIWIPYNFHKNRRRFSKQNVAELHSSSRWQCGSGLLYIIRIESCSVANFKRIPMYFPLEDLELAIQQYLRIWERKTVKRPTYLPNQKTYSRCLRHKSYKVKK